MVEKLKKNLQEKYKSYIFKQYNQVSVSRYGSNKDLLFNGLKLIKIDWNVEIFFALNGNKQKYS